MNLVFLKFTYDRSSEMNFIVKDLLHTFVNICVQKIVKEKATETQQTN